MASQERTERLKELVALAGSLRKAEAKIKEVAGVAPTNSALYKATRIDSKITDYVVECYIRDLKKALE